MDGIRNEDIGGAARVRCFLAIELSEARLSRSGHTPRRDSEHISRWTQMIGGAATEDKLNRRCNRFINYDLFYEEFFI